MAATTSEKSRIPLSLLVGFTVLATGGPLALVALFLPGEASGASVGLVSLVGLLAFAAPVAVWVKYSRHVASPGGLTAFVEAGAGRHLALAQAAVWIVSYFLYLPYTIDYVVYDVLPAVFPRLGWGRPLLEIGLPLCIVGLALVRIRTALAVTAVVAVAQLGLLVVLVIVGLEHVGVTSAAVGAHGAAGHLATKAANLSLLYVCVSLPLYFGGELVGGGRTLRRGLVAGFVVSGLFVVTGSLLWARPSTSLLAAPIPGTALARAAWGSSFATVVGVGVAASVLGVVVAEYFALGRLVHAVSGWRIGPSSAVVGAGFVVTSAVALVDPQAFYAQLLKPSLVALWVAQIPVFAALPRFARRHREPMTSALILALGAGALVVYGLVQALRAALS